MGPVSVGLTGRPECSYDKAGFNCGLSAAALRTNSNFANQSESRFDIGS